MPIKFTFESSGRETKKTDITAPLPVLGISTEFAFSPRVVLIQSADLLYIKLGNFEARVADIKIAVDYNAWDNFGLGMGLNTFRLNIKADGEDYPLIDFSGDIGFGYTGLFAYAKYYAW